MKVAFPTSIPTIPKVDIASTYIGFDCLSKRPGFAEALNIKADQGANVVHIGNDISMYNHPEKLDTIVSMVGNHYGNGTRSGTLVVAESPGKHNTWYAEYLKACCDPKISVIAIAMPVLTGGHYVSSPFDNIMRILYIKKLVDENKFCTDKMHWLYGVSNPAELAMYSTLFSNFVASRFELAICSTCFLYSIFGIPFSMSSGIIERLPGIADTNFGDLGIDEWIDYAMSQEQMRRFYLNADVVQAFASGTIASKYADRVYAILEEGML